jgi:hypothetical protein
MKSIGGRGSNPRALRLPRVCGISGYTSVNDLSHAGGKAFSQRIELSERAVGFEREAEQRLAQRIESRGRGDS